MGLAVELLGTEVVGDTTEQESVSFTEVQLVTTLLEQ